MKKIIICLVAVIIVCLGCSVAPIEEEKTELSLRITWKAYSGRGEAIAKIVTDFNQSQEDVHIKLVSGDEDADAIDSHLSATDIDLYVLPYRYVMSFGQEGSLKVVDPKTIKALPTIDPALLSLGTVEDQLYGIPWLSHSMAILYNKDIIDKAGIDIAAIQSTDDFYKALVKVEEYTPTAALGLVGQDHNDLSWMVNQFIYGYGGQLLDGNDVVINSEASKEALHFYKDKLGACAQENWQDHNGTDVMDLFRQGEIAFEIQSLWGITDIWKNGQPFDVGIMPLEQIGMTSEVGPMMFAMDKDVSKENEEKLIHFINYMLSQSSQIAIMHGEYSVEKDSYYPFRLPVRSDLLKDHLFDDYAIFSVFLTSYAHASIDVPSPKWMKVKEDIYTPLLHQWINDQISLETMLSTIEDEGERIMRGED